MEAVQCKCLKSRAVITLWKCSHWGQAKDIRAAAAGFVVDTYSWGQMPPMVGFFFFFWWKALLCWQISHYIVDVFGKSSGGFCSQRREQLEIGSKLSEDIHEWFWLQMSSKSPSRENKSWIIFSIWAKLVCDVSISLCWYRISFNLIVQTLILSIFYLLISFYLLLFYYGLEEKKKKKENEDQKQGNAIARRLSMSICSEKIKNKSIKRGLCYLGEYGELYRHFLCTSNGKTWSVFRTCFDFTESWTTWMKIHPEDFMPLNFAR